MKIFLGLIATVLAAAPALAADVGVSIAIGEPGFYGRIDIGNAPAPVLVYREPIVVIQPQVVAAPIYLRVPPGHSRHWKDHCAAYGACGQRVYFVQDSWYSDVYAPYYHKQHGHGGKGGQKDNGNGNGKGKGNKG